MVTGSVDIRIDWRTAEVRRFLDQMKPARQKQALSVAVNTTARQVRTAAARDVAREMGTTRKEIDSAVYVRPYSQPSTLEAIVRGRGLPLPLMKFAARQTRKGVTAKAWGTRRTYPGTFIAKMKSGHTGVFRRTSKGRLPIKELFGAGVAQVMAQDAVRDHLRTTATTRLQANILRQLDRYTRSAARRKA